MSSYKRINNPSGHIYDAAGNLIETPNPGGIRMTYDGENRMTAGGGVTYTYDGDGKRVAKLIPSRVEGSNGKLYWYPSTALGAGGMSRLDALVETDGSGSSMA